MSNIELGDSGPHHQIHQPYTDIGHQVNERVQWFAGASTPFPGYDMAPVISVNPSKNVELALAAKHPHSEMQHSRHFVNGIETSGLRDAETVKLVQTLASSAQHLVGNIVDRPMSSIIHGADHLVFEKPLGFGEAGIEVCEQEARRQCESLQLVTRRAIDILQKQEFAFTQWMGPTIYYKVVETLQQLETVQLPSILTVPLRPNDVSENTRTSGLSVALQQALGICDLVQYTSLSQQVDEGHFGVFPTVVAPPHDGFFFDFKSLHDPRTMRKTSVLLTGNFPQAALRRLAALRLCKRISDNTYVWTEGIHRQSVENCLSKLSEHIENDELSSILHHFDTNCSQAFGDVSLGKERLDSGALHTTQIIHAPNGAGKSIYLRAVRDACMLGMRGRVVSATSATMSVPYAVTDNFAVSSRQGASTLHAHLEWIDAVLRSPTPQHTLALADEFLHAVRGEADRIALSWAFFEECAKRGIRLMAITQSSDLAEYFGDPNGLEKLRGTFIGNRTVSARNGTHGATVVSINRDHTIESLDNAGDSALTMAGKVCHDTPFVSRAHEISEILTKA